MAYHQFQPRYVICRTIKYLHNHNKNMQHLQTQKTRSHRANAGREIDVFINASRSAQQNASGFSCVVANNVNFIFHCISQVVIIHNCDKNHYFAHIHTHVRKIYRFPILVKVLLQQLKKSFQTYFDQVNNLLTDQSINHITKVM